MVRNILVLPALCLMTACGSYAEQPSSTEASEAELSLSLLAEGLEFPWGMAFLPNGDLLVTEREGRLRLVRDGELITRPVDGIPDNIRVAGQGGLLDVELHPEFDTNRLVYISYSKGTFRQNYTAVARGKLNEDGTALLELEEIFHSNMPDKRGGRHFGSRMVFLPDSTLLVSLGDGGGFRDEAQNLENHFGTIIRITDAGGVPADNPFTDTEGADPKIYTYGNRNVQGMVFDAERDRIYAHEHGPLGGDELNYIEAGTNYGWPVITHGINYDGTIISTETEAEGMAQPAVNWVPSIAPSGMVLYSGDIHPEWNGDLLLGAMNGPDGQKMVRVDLDEVGNVVGVEDFFTDAQIPFRDVEVGPDGHIYLVTAELDGRLFRVDLGF